MPAPRYLGIRACECIPTAGVLTVYYSKPLRIYQKWAQIGCFSKSRMGAAPVEARVLRCSLESNDDQRHYGAMSFVWAGTLQYPPLATTSLYFQFRWLLSSHPGPGGSVNAFSYGNFRRQEVSDLVVIETMPRHIIPAVWCATCRRLELNNLPSSGRRMKTGPPPL